MLERSHFSPCIYLPLTFKNSLTSYQLGKLTADMASTIAGIQQIYSGLKKMRIGWIGLEAVTAISFSGIGTIAGLIVDVASAALVATGAAQVGVGCTAANTGFNKFKKDVQYFRTIKWTNHGNKHVAPRDVS